MPRPKLTIIVPNLPGAAAPVGESLHVLCSRFLQQRAAGLEPKTVRNYARTFELAASLPEHPTPGHIQTWLAILQRSGAAKTAQLHRDNLRAVYSWANNCGWVVGNPVALTSKVQGADLPPRAIEFSGEDCERWRGHLEAVKEFTRGPEFLSVLRFSGVRPSEALGLMPRDVRREHDCAWRVTIERQRPESVWSTKDYTKSRKRRRIELHPRLLELLPALAKQPLASVWRGRGGQSEWICPFLFPFNAGHLDKMLASLRAVDAEAFPVNDAWYAYRHTFCVETMRRGVSVQDAFVMMGHRDLKHFQTYAAALLGSSARKGVWGP